MAKIAGKSWQLEVGGAAGAVITGHNGLTLTVNTTPIETTTKDSASDFREFLPGLIGFSGEVEGIYDSSTSSNEQVDSLWTPISTGVSVALDFTDGVSDYAGTFYVTEFSVSGDQEGPTTFSASLQGTGVLTKAATA